MVSWPARLLWDRVVKLAIDGMTCAADPYIINAILLDVPGVQRVDVSWAENRATVIFDDAEVDIARLTQATSMAGFPARPVGN